MAFSRAERIRGRASVLCNRAMRRLALIASLGTAACFNPDGPGADTDAAGSSTDATEGATQTSPPSSGGPSTTGPTSTTDPTGPTSATDPTGDTDPTDDTNTSGPSTESGPDSTSTGGSSSTTDFVPGCDNGIVEDDELCFEDAVELDTLVSSQGVVIADLDGYDHLDVVVGDSGDGTVGGVCEYEYLGNGDGSFSDAIDSGDDTPVAHVAAGPIAEGVVDVIARRTSGGNAILCYRRNDDGTFSSIVPFVGATSSDIAFAAVNGDGRLDALGKAGAVNVLLGNASENFGVVQSYGNSPGTQCVRAVDLDGDEDLDVLACTAAGIYPLINDGNGVLEPGTFFGTSSADPVVGDFDGDGNADVASAENSVVSSHFRMERGFSDGPEVTVHSSAIAGKTSDLVRSSCCSRTSERMS